MAERSQIEHELPSSPVAHRREKGSVKEAQENCLADNQSRGDANRSSELVDPVPGSPPAGAVGMICGQGLDRPKRPQIGSIRSEADGGLGTPVAARSGVVTRDVLKAFQRGSSIGFQQASRTKEMVDALDSGAAPVFHVQEGLGSSSCLCANSNGNSKVVHSTDPAEVDIMEEPTRHPVTRFHEL
ncbi:predicted protein [Histoplasma capsulatum var. duboisii H88]|uniref:Predicted protein n=1 Tax=Ajellomyces capsulatus (strain H88) TaxID=544711 RepID=F0UW40_AJEC8|nr:predicted protein [Histoplasma capsulatum var. duboisii H88]